MFHAVSRRFVRDLMQLTLVLDEPLVSADDMLRRLRALGLRRIERCRLTRNRSVMVSFGNGELRVHEGYLAAPHEVLAAVVRFVEGATRRDRLLARRLLLSFSIPSSSGAPATRGVQRSTHPGDTGLAARLTEWHARYNEQYFGGELRPLEIRVSRRMRARLGHYTASTPAGDPPEIAISRRHVRRHGWAEALQTLLHEMVHQWQDERGLPIDHGRTFGMKARELGIPPFARRTVAA